MAKAIQFEYVRETKREEARLLVLDDGGNIWICELPFSKNAEWLRLIMPFVQEEEEAPE
jgi:hypothetical protein